MVNQQLLDWINAQQTAGQDTKQIYAKLIQQGYRPDQATEALNSLNGVSKKGFSMPQLPVSAGVICAGLFFFALTVSGIVMLFTGGPSEEPFDLTSLSVDVPTLTQSFGDQEYESLEPEIERVPLAAEPAPPEEGYFEDDTLDAGEDTSEEPLDETDGEGDSLADESTTDEFIDETVDNATQEPIKDTIEIEQTPEEYINDTTTDDTTQDTVIIDNPTTNDTTSDDVVTEDNITEQNDTVISGDLSPDIGQEAPPIPESATILYQGIFIPQSRPGTGEALVFEIEGVKVLRLESFQIVEGPDLRVLLSTDLTIENGIELGPNQGIDGGTYDYLLLPSVDVSTHNNILIWSVPLETLFTSATLS